MIEMGIASSLLHDDDRLRAAIDRAREADLQASEQLLRVMSNVLDIRQVFPQRLGDRAIASCRTTA